MESDSSNPSSGDEWVLVEDVKEIKTAATNQGMKTETTNKVVSAVADEREDVKEIRTAAANRGMETETTNKGVSAVVDERVVVEDVKEVKTAATNQGMKTETTNKVVSAVADERIVVEDVKEVKTPAANQGMKTEISNNVVSAAADERVVVEVVKEVKTPAANQGMKMEIANKGVSAVADENGTEKGETSAKLVTNNRKNAENDVRLKKQEMYNRARFWCRYIILFNMTMLGWSISFRSKIGAGVLLLYYVVFFITHTALGLRATNWIRVHMAVIKNLGIAIVCSGLVILLEGVIRRPFLFGGAATVFTTCSWTILVIVFHLWYISNDFTVTKQCFCRGPKSVWSKMAVVLNKK